MNSKDYGVGRFICDHPFITWFIVDGAISLVKYGIYVAACLSNDKNPEAPEGILQIVKANED